VLDDGYFASNVGFSPALGALIDDLLSLKRASRRIYLIKPVKDFIVLCSG
jgi:hypothetical protein